jgi:flagellar protein FlbD
MIQLTRLNQQPIVVNAELIKFVEATPDTVITLVTGDKLAVREPVDTVVDRAVAYRAHFGGTPGSTCAAALASARPAADDTEP